MKIALGTVQFGLDYGAFNASGKISVAMVRDILDLARASGVDTLDTAHAYGDSESVLGECRAPEKFRIVTKIPVKAPDIDAAKFVGDQFEASLRSLNASNVFGLLMHSAADLLGTPGDIVWASLERLKRSGRVVKIGVSVYSTDEAENILNRYPIDLIQLPYNVFDRRFERSGVIQRCAAGKVEVHARSAFLQGLVLADPDRLSPDFEIYAPIIREFQDVSRTLGVEPIEAALAICSANEGVSRVVVGVDGLEQFRTILGAVAREIDVTAFSKFESDDTILLNPSMWAK